MSYTRILFGGIKTVTKAEPLQKGVIESIKKSTPITKNLFEEMPNFIERFAPESNFYKFSPNTQDNIVKMLEKIWANCKNKKTLALLNRYETILNNIIKYSPDENFVAKVTQSMTNYSNYIKRNNRIIELFKSAKSSSLALKTEILAKLTIMSYTNPKSFKALWKSKGIDEIAAGKLDIDYLKNLKVTDDIDDNFFYKLFDDLEKSTNEKLVKAGIDKDAANKFLKACDENVCMDAKFTENFIRKLEDINNPELANKLLNRFNFDEYFVQYGQKHFDDLLEAAIDNPEIVEKVLKIKDLYTPPVAMNIVKMFENTSRLKITDELFEYYLKIEKQMPDKVRIYTLESMNEFLNIKGTNPTMLKKIITEFSQQKTNYSVDMFLESVTQENLPYLKMCLNKGKINRETWEKLKLIKMQPEKFADASSWTKLDEYYQKTFLPIKNMLAKKFDKDIDYYTDCLLQLKAQSPEKWQKLVDLKFFEYIENGKINPRILTSYDLTKSEFLPEIYSDLEKLNRGESLIKKFNSTKDILRQTQAGDVVSIKGKMYINNNGKLEPWNMSEEKFNELFPLVDRFSTRQGRDDCYLITTLNSLYQNPKTRGTYYKFFEQKGDDIIVTIPAYKDFRGAITFPKGEIELSPFSANAAKHTQMLERTYERTALRSSDTTAINSDPITTTNLDDLNKRIRGGREEEVLKELLCDLRAQGKVTTKKIFTSKKGNEKIEQAITDFANNPNYIITYGTLPKNGSGHALSIKSYNPETKTLTITDPMEPAVTNQITMQDWINNLLRINITRFK